jgi:hypothetical protein
MTKKTQTERSPAQRTQTERALALALIAKKNQRTETKMVSVRLPVAIATRLSSGGNVGKTIALALECYWKILEKQAKIGEE